MIETLQSPSKVVPLLATLLDQRGAEVEAWFKEQYHKTEPNFYSSVDLRHSGEKLVPVDTNLFPAGFNHLSEAAVERGAVRLKDFLARQHTPIARVMIIPENHTRNIGYLDNLAALKTLIEKAGLQVVIASLVAEERLELPRSNDQVLVQEKLAKEGARIRTADGFDPELIVINNDLTGGIPDILKGTSQMVVPNLARGWFRRRKTVHFDAYDRVARQFCEAFGVDSWRLTSVFEKCGLVDFGERKGIECVALAVERAVHRIGQKYKEYGIEAEPYVYIKSDSGTYGMGIMTARSGDEVVEMNKKTRNKMNVIKEGVQSTEVVIQEGIPTVDTVNGAPAEPMIYCIDGYAVGGAFRVNEERDTEGNLNARGMRFAGMCDQVEKTRDHVQVPPCSFGVFNLVAQLATMAAAREEYGENYSI